MAQINYVSDENNDDIRRNVRRRVSTRDSGDDSIVVLNTVNFVVNRPLNALSSIVSTLVSAPNTTAPTEAARQERYSCTRQSAANIITGRAGRCIKDEAGIYDTLTMCQQNCGSLPTVLRREVYDYLDIGDFGSLHIVDIENKTEQDKNGNKYRPLPDYARSAEINMKQRELEALLQRAYVESKADGGRDEKKIVYALKQEIFKRMAALDRRGRTPLIGLKIMIVGRTLPPVSEWWYKLYPRDEGPSWQSDVVGLMLDFLEVNANVRNDTTDESDALMFDCYTRLDWQTENTRILE